MAAVEHSSEAVAALLDLASGQGGGKLLVLGEFQRDRAYWAGLRLGPVPTLLEAVLRCLLAGPYERIVAFTGYGSRGLPSWRIGHGLTLGDEAVVWVVRGERKPQPRPADGERRRFEISLDDLGPTSASFDRLLWRSERQSYWDRLEEFVRQRDGEIVQARDKQRRSALVVDLGFLLPAPQEVSIFRRQDGAAVESRIAQGIQRSFPLPTSPDLTPCDLVLLAEDGLANELLDPEGRLLHTALPTFLGEDWQRLSPLVEGTAPRLFLGPGFASATTSREASPFRSRSLDLTGGGGAKTVYEMIRGARISHRPSRAVPPRYPNRIDLEFWADIDLGPLERAFEQEIIGQRAVKRGILDSLRAYSARCRELLLRNPAAIKTAADEGYRLPVISLFGAAGMGKTTFCRVMAQHLFGSDELTSIIDLSGKLLGTETLGVAPPYVGWDQESTLNRFARESRGLGLVCFDEFVRLQRLNQESLANSLSPLLELLQSRSFVPASPRFVPPGRRHHMANTVFVFAGNVSPPGEAVPEGFQPIEALGSALARRLAESGSIFYFEPLQDEDFHTATAISLRGGAKRWALDFMPHLAPLVDDAVIEDELLNRLSAIVRESVRQAGGQASIAFVRGQVAGFPYERSFDAIARRDGRLILGRELLDLEAEL